MQIKKLSVQAAYLWVPVCTKAEAKLLEILLKNGEMLFSFSVPAGQPVDFYAALPLHRWMGKEIILQGDVTEEFLKMCRLSDVSPENFCFKSDRDLLADTVAQVPAGAEDTGTGIVDSLRNMGAQAPAGTEVIGTGIVDSLRDTVAQVPAGTGRTFHGSAPRPSLHFTAQTGWINDPNGLLYDGEFYHLFFQHNPFHVQWGNMSWGHAISKDLLSWAQLDDVLYPDARGTCYSGCAVKENDRIVICYTAAGGTNDWSKKAGAGFTQRLAISTDGGRSFQKEEMPALSEQFAESRDPKIFYHDASKAWIMVLWLKDNDFGIYRSKDLRGWEQTQTVTLPGAWECPGLFALQDEDGQKAWFFWTADGYYYNGNFDGYQLTDIGPQKRAYLTKLSYAAQVFEGTPNRTVSMPWLKVPGDGKTYCGAHGIPVELTWKQTPDGPVILQRPVKELFDIFPPQVLSEAQTVYETAAETVFLSQPIKKAATYTWQMRRFLITYDAAKMELSVNGHGHSLPTDPGEIFLLVDGDILEIFLKDCPLSGSFSALAGEAPVRI